MKKELMVKLDGDMSSVEVVFEKNESHRRSPLICSSTRGSYTPINGALRRSEDAEQVEELADCLSDADDGAFVALVDESPRRPPLAIIQSSFGRSSKENFYQRVHGATHRIWRDFYFRTIFTALEEADSRWKPKEVVMKHLNGGSWNEQTYKVALEALGFLADQRILSFKTLHIECVHGHDAGVANFQAAMESLNHERMSENASDFRLFEKYEATFAEIGAPDVQGARLFRIPVERADDAAVETPQ